MIYTYQKGQWIENTTFPELKEDENFDEYLKRVGFPIQTINFGCGDDEDFGFYVYERVEDNKDDFFIMIYPLASKAYLVFIPDFISLMMFLREYTQVFTLQNLLEKLEEMHKTITKIFRVYHGHDPDSCCRQCDPVAFEKFEQKKKEKRNQKMMHSL